MRKLHIPVLLLTFSVICRAYSQAPISTAPVAGTSSGADITKVNPPNAASASPPAGTVTPGSSLSALARKTLPLEISVANYYDLVLMAKRLGLSEAGAAAQLRERISIFYGIFPAPTDAEAPAVLIERADEASLFRIEETDNSMVKVSGGVRLSVKMNDGTVHRISATSVVYDRKRNAVSAEGNVRYELESGNSLQVFTGSTVVADLDDWTGVFLDGGFKLAGADSKQSTDRSLGQPAVSAAARQSAAPLSGSLGSLGSSVSGLAIEAKQIVKRTGDVIVVQDASLSSCDEEEPHYFIHAGKVWMLGNGDWAISDASLFIGRVPVLWLPFFYYPSEEIVFHPVIGSRTREGRYIQTTTWLIGEKSIPASSGSFLSIARDEGGGTERRIEGLFFRTRARESGKDVAAAVGQTPGASGSGQRTRFLKLLIDAYSSLGIYAGMDGSFSDKSGKNSIAFSAGIGISRSLFYTTNGTWSPYSEASSWTSVWNTTDLGSITLPFRFGADIKTTFSLTPFKSAMTGRFFLPLFSDPYFEQDFRGRNEEMDWLQILSSTTTDAIKPAKRSSLVQRLEFSGSLKTSGSKPELLSSIDLSRLGISAIWYSKTASFSPVLIGNAASVFAVNPQREFFYPDTVRLLDFSINLKGTLLRFPQSAAAAATSAADETPDFRLPQPTAENPAGSMSPDGVPTAKPAVSRTDAVPTATEAASESALGTGSLGGFRLPGLSGSTKPLNERTSPSKPFTLLASWNLSPSVFFENRFKSDVWKKVSDIDYQLYYSLLSTRITGGIDARTGILNDLAVVSATLGILGQDQTRPYFNDTRSDTSTVNPLILSDYQYKTAKLTGNLKASISPFKDIWLLSQSSLSYNLAMNLYSYRFSALSGPGQTGSPIYTQSFASWDRNAVSAHNASISFAIRPRGLVQKLGFTANLPPLNEAYTLDLGLDAGFAKFSAQGQTVRSVEETSYTLNPLSATLSFGSGTWPRIASSLVYNVQSAAVESSTTSFSWSSFNASLLYRYSSGYTISPARTWISDGILSFRAESFSLGFNPAFKSKTSSSNPWSISLTSSLTQNLVRFSESALSLGLSSKINLGKDFSLTFSGVTKNSSVWRYYTFLFKPSGTFDPDDYKKNLFVDIADSLSVWDPVILKRSLLKLTSLSIAMQQNLHDWDLGVTVGASPLLVDPDGAKPYYTLNVSFSILVKWHDIPDISSKITKDSSGLSF